MKKKSVWISLKEGWKGILFAVGIGVLGYSIKIVTKSPIADPLLVAMIMGIVVRTGLSGRSELKKGFALAPAIFIPVGIVFYGAKNLNFAEAAQMDIGMIVLLMLVIFVYLAVICTLGELLKQKREITYLTATGSAICGASAIVITSPAVEAKADDISISLLSVTLAALVGLFIILPFFSILLGINNKIYGLFAGSVLQFTGFVKAAVKHIPFLAEKIPEDDLMSFALSVKAIRYLGLLVTIPFFASIVKKRIYVPWFLWAFLGAGLLGTWVYSTKQVFYARTMIPLIKPVYNISWSIAMAAVGLNADAKQLLSNNGTKALIMAFAGFVAAAITFFAGIYLCHL